MQVTGLDRLVWRAKVAGRIFCSRVGKHGSTVEALQTSGESFLLTASVSLG
jgi:hypothetical protein